MLPRVSCRLCGFCLPREENYGDDPLLDVHYAVTYLERDDPAELDRRLPMWRHFVCMQSGRGTTPLMLAAALSRPNLVEAMLRAGAPPNAADHRGNTALHFAVVGPSSELAARCVRLICARTSTNVDAIAECVCGVAETPLIRAAQSGRVRIVTSLLRQDARIVAASVWLPWWVWDPIGVGPSCWPPRARAMAVAIVHAIGGDAGTIVARYACHRKL